MSVSERLRRRYRRAWFRIRLTLGLIKKEHRVTVIGFWCNDEGCYASPDANGIPDLELRYLVECYWCGALGDFADPAEAIRFAYEHSPDVDRGLFNRSRLHIEEALREQRRRQEVVLSGRLTTFGPRGSAK